MGIFSRLQDELLAVRPQDFCDTDEEVGDQETVVGVMTDELKALYTLLRDAEQEIDYMVQEIDAVIRRQFGDHFSGDLSHAELVELLGEDFYHRQRQSATRFAYLYGLFWYEARQLWPQLNCQNGFGIRTGFKIVSFADKDSEEEMHGFADEDEATDLSAGGLPTLADILGYLPVDGRLIIGDPSLN